MFVCKYPTAPISTSSLVMGSLYLTFALITCCRKHKFIFIFHSFSVAIFPNYIIRYIGQLIYPLICCLAYVRIIPHFVQLITPFTGFCKTFFGYSSLCLRVCTFDSFRHIKALCHSYSLLLISVSFYNTSLFHQSALLQLSFLSSFFWVFVYFISSPCQIQVICPNEQHFKTLIGSNLNCLVLKGGRHLIIDKTGLV